MSQAEQEWRLILLWVLKVGFTLPVVYTLLIIFPEA